MLGVIILILLIVVYTLVGGLNIASAISNYKRGRYFICGTSIMVATWMICNIAKVIFSA